MSPSDLGGLRWCLMGQVSLSGLKQSKWAYVNLDGPKEVSNRPSVPK